MHSLRRKKRGYMYAVVEVAGKQYRVSKDDKLYIPKMSANEGEEVTFDKVLLSGSGADVSIGTPLVEGASVTAEVLAHVKADKVLVLRKKRRKGFRTLNGHRQQYTRVQIKSLNS